MLSRGHMHRAIRYSNYELAVTKPKPSGSSLNVQELDTVITIIWLQFNFSKQISTGILFGLNDQLHIETRAHRAHTPCAMVHCECY